MDRIQSKAARLQRIEHRLYNAPRGLRVAELAEYCGVDRRTIYRDLQALEEMGAPIWESEGRYGIDRESYLSTIRLNLNEAVALFFAARLLAHHSDEHNPNVVSALAVGRGWLRVGWRRRCERVCGGMSILQIVRSICWSTLH